jgi:hypothetical protein
MKRKIEKIKIDFKQLKQILTDSIIKDLENMQIKNGYIHGFEWKNGYIEIESNKKLFIPKDYIGKKE